MTETFRGAYLAIPRGQIEAGIACGMSSALVFIRIIWPQLVRYALPSFGNNWLVLLKATALVSVLGLHELVWESFTAGRSTRQLFTFFFVTLLIYLVLTAISDVGLRWLDRKYSVGVRRA
jgi:histidine transport system permease protein/arginine/ornithine transport system permease protein